MPEHQVLFVSVMRNIDSNQCASGDDVSDLYWQKFISRLQHPTRPWTGGESGVARALSLLAPTEQYFGITVERHFRCQGADRAKVVRWFSVCTEKCNVLLLVPRARHILKIKCPSRRKGARIGCRMPLRRWQALSIGKRASEWCPTEAAEHRESESS